MPRFTKRPKNGGNQDKRKCSKRAAKTSDLEESENTQSCCKSEARIAPADRESAFNFVARVGAVGEVQSLCLFDSALLPGPCAWIAESDGSWFSGGSPPSIQSPHAFDGFLITEKTWLPSLPATTLEQDTQEEGVPCQEGTEMKSQPCSPPCSSSLFSWTPSPTFHSCRPPLLTCISRRSRCRLRLWLWFPNSRGEIACGGETASFCFQPRSVMFRSHPRLVRRWNGDAMALR